MPSFFRAYPRPVVPVDNLPNEILIEIFLWHNTMSSGRDRSLPRRAYPCNGFNLMLVCHRWHVLAISTPCLWQAIKVRGNVEWFNLALLRSESLPLDVVVHRSASSSNISKCSRLLSPSSAASAPCCCISPPMHVQNRVLNAILGRPMPRLAELSILLDSDSESLTGGPLNLSPDRLPALRSLCVSSCAISWHPTMLSTLRRLHLDECTCQGGSVTLDDLLDVLAAAAAAPLQDLRLRNFVCALRQRSQSSISQDQTATRPRPPRPRPVILLPTLRKLDVYDLPHHVSRFLSFVRLAPHTHVRITGLVLEAVPDTRDAFRALLPADGDTSGLPLLRLATVGRVLSCDSRTCRIEGQMALSPHLQPHSPPPEAPQRRPSPRPWAANCAWAGLGVQVRLRIRGRGVPVGAVAALGQVPYGSDNDDSDEEGEEEEASADGRGQLQDAEAGCPGDAGSGSGDGAARGLVLPNLRSLSFGSVDWCPGLVEALVLVIQRRVANGLPRLEKLELRWKKTGDVDERGLRRTMKTYRRTLASSVEEVEESFATRDRGLGLGLAWHDVSDESSTNSETDTEDEW